MKSRSTSNQHGIGNGSLYHLVKAIRALADGRVSLGVMEDEPQDLSITEDGIKKFVQYYGERVRSEQDLSELEWEIGGRMEYVYFWLKSEKFEEPVKVPLNIRRATQPLEDLEAIKRRIYSSFTEAARKLASRRAG